MTSIQWIWEGPEKQQIFARMWRVEAPRGLIIILHGLAEHSGRYDDLAGYLSQFGWQVVALDLPGHGNTPGRAGHVRSWQSLKATVEAFVAHQQINGLPLYLYGHSMGAALALQLAVEGRLPLRGVIASAPPVRIAQPVPHWQLILGRMFRRLLPWIRLDNGVDPAHLSRDSRVVRRYLADPLVQSKVSIALGLGLVEIGPWLERQASRINIPILMIHGDADRIAAISGSRKFCELAGNWCHWIEWPGYYHELHHEPGWRQVLAAVAGWLDEQNAQRPDVAKTN